jgi:uncharacterized membrane protein
MFHKRLLTAAAADKRGFRYRGKDVSRLEAFSDCEFAFALTLIVVALEVPKSADDLLALVRGFPAFGVCFAVLLSVWWVHHRFFRRYGINDLPIFLLNGVLLFVVLFFVYPLRFLFGQMLGADGRSFIDIESARGLFTIYGSGFAAVYAAFTLMHAHAWRLREQLSLDELERWMTLETIAQHSVLAGFGILSVVIARAVDPRYIAYAGWCFFLIPIPLTIIGTWFGNRIGPLQRGASPARAGARTESNVP